MTVQYSIVHPALPMCPPVEATEDLQLGVEHEAVPRHYLPQEVEADLLKTVTSQYAASFSIQDIEAFPDEGLTSVLMLVTRECVLMIIEE